MQIKTFIKSISMICFILFSWSAAAEQIPMWEGINKSPSQIMADKRFTSTIRAKGSKSVNRAIFRAIQLGWQFVAKKQPDTAIKRFNQAWLLSPNHPDIHWGFAVATHLQRKPLSVVERHFRKAESLKKNNPALFADHGRILENSGQHKKAIVYFKKALAIDPNHRDAHVGMWRAHKALGDMVTADKHRRRIK